MMNKTQKPNRYNIFKSFRYAVIGLISAFRKEPNLVIQAIIGSTSTIYFFYFSDITLAIANFVMVNLVISLELVNTSFEYLCDLIDSDHNKKVMFIKDVAAAAVFFASLGWLTILLYGVYTTLIT